MRGMETDTVAQIKSRLSIADVVMQYTKLTRAGSSFKGRCPFHTEKTPSFMVSPERGTYHCFGCGVHGDIFTFVQEIDGVDFKGALKMLAERAGVPLVYAASPTRDAHERLFLCMEEATVFFQQQLGIDHPGRAYLHKRGLTDETIHSFRIGWAPSEWHALSSHLSAKGFTAGEMSEAGLTKEGDKGAYDRLRSRIIFPINDAAGRVVGFSGRIFALPGTEHPADVAKYMNSPETPLFKKSRILYGFDRARQSMRKHKCAILVEGQMDLVMVHQAGWGNTVAVSGTALTEEHVVLVHRMTDNLLLALDSDDAGVAAAQKSAAIALAQGMDVKVVRLEGGKDPADILLHDGKDAWNKAVREAKHVIVFLLAVYEERSRDTRDFAKRVETEVLPFIARIRSPIDRDHFIRVVAERIGVSPESVREGVVRVPVMHEQHSVRSGVVQKGEVSGISPRALEAWSILETEKHKEKPAFDVAEGYMRFERALGTQITEIPLSEDQKEAARFRSETMYHDARMVREGFDLLLVSIERERLRNAYEQAKRQLHSAEREGDEGKIAAALELCTALSAQLAQMG